jgi:hypothetical protein
MVKGSIGCSWISVGVAGRLVKMGPWPTVSANGSEAVAPRLLRAVMVTWYVWVTPPTGGGVPMSAAVPLPLSTMDSHEGTVPTRLHWPAGG